MTTRAGQFLTTGPAISLLAGPVRAPRSPSPFRWFRRLQVGPVGQYLSVPVVNYGPSLAAKELHGSRVVGVLGPAADSVSWVFKYRPCAPFLRCPTPRQHLRRRGPHEGCPLPPPSHVSAWIEFPASPDLGKTSPNVLIISIECRTKCLSSLSHWGTFNCSSAPLEPPWSALLGGQ